MSYSLRRVGISCVLLLVLVTSASPKKCTSASDGQLLLAEKGRIWRSNSAGENRELMANYSSSSGGIFGLDYDPVRNVLYWCEPHSRAVRALEDAGAAQAALPSRDNWLPVSLAVDPLADRLYVAEGLSDSVQAYQPGTGPIVVVGTNASELRDIALDPYAGYLFVLDRYQIFRTDLDGENYLPIYSETGSALDIVNELPAFFRNILDYSVQRDAPDTRLYKKSLSIADIALDLDGRRVYWANQQRVQSSDYDGQDLRTHFEDESALGLHEPAASLAFLDGNLYWASDVTEMVVKIDVDNVNRSRVILKNVKAESMKGINSCSVHRELDNLCADGKAKCQQLCIRSRSSKDKYRCACSLGYELTEDSRSCVLIQDFLLYTQSQYVRGRLLNSDRQGLVDVLDPTKYEVGAKSVLDYDAEAGLVYYAGLYPKNKLHRLDLASGEQSVLQPDLLSRDVGQFAYDWTTRNLYYFAYYYADATFLCVSRAGNASKVLLDSVEGLVRAMALHPHRGYLFFAQLFDEENRGRISQLGMDGSNLTVIVHADQIDTLDGLAVDYDEDRIYWSQSQRSARTNGVWKAEIRHSKLNGRDVEALSLPGSLARPDSLAVHGSSLYAILDGELLIRMDKRTGRDVVRLAGSETPGLLGGLRLYSRAFQAVGQRPCAALGCEGLCLLKPVGVQGPVAVCACPYGERLAEDGRTCLENRSREPAFLPCQFDSFKCKRQTAAL